MLRILFWSMAGFSVMIAIAILAISQTRTVRQEIAAKEKAAQDNSFLPHAAPSITFSSGPQADIATKPAAFSLDCQSRRQSLETEVDALRDSNGIAQRSRTNPQELTIKLRDGRFVNFTDSGCDHGRYIFVTAHSTHSFAVVAHVRAPDKLSALVVSTETGRITELNGLPIFASDFGRMVLTHGAGDGSMQPYLTIYLVAGDRLLPQAWCVVALRKRGERLELRELMPATAFLLTRIGEHDREKGSTLFQRDKMGWLAVDSRTTLGLRTFHQSINERCLTSAPDFSRLH